MSRQQRSVLPSIHKRRLCACSEVVRDIAVLLLLLLLLIPSECSVTSTPGVRAGDRGKPTSRASVQMRPNHTQFSPLGSPLIRAVVPPPGILSTLRFCLPGRPQPSIYRPPPPQVPRPVLFRPNHRGTERSYLDLFHGENTRPTFLATAPQQTISLRLGGTSHLPLTFLPPALPGKKQTRRNCFHSRAVLARGGKAERLTYDHKAEDASEQERVNAAGGFVLRNRVLGILAVSRSFGNQGMKELVTAVPYVSETRWSLRLFFFRGGVARYCAFW